jgi:hypothetical protein
VTVGIVIFPAFNTNLPDLTFIVYLEQWCVLRKKIAGLPEAGVEGFLEVFVV